MQSDSFSPDLRQEWMALLAKADWSDLKPLWQTAPEMPECIILRKPETGLIMLRGRMGGSGQTFNTGEATATRCSVESKSGVKGHAYILGRNKEHALAAAELDAGLQDNDCHNAIAEHVIKPLKKIHSDRLETHRRKVAATKVDFFTLVRGEDG